MNETAVRPISPDTETGRETPAELSANFWEKLVGIGEAASLTGRSKGQIGRDSNTKKLPYVLDENGHKRYRVRDLHKLYQLKRPGETGRKSVETLPETGRETPPGTIRETPLAAVELAVLQERLKAREETIRRQEQEITDLRQNRDRLLDQNIRFTMLLSAPLAAPVAPTPDPAPTPEPEPPAPVAVVPVEATQEQPAKRRSWWSRIFT